MRLQSRQLPPHALPQPSCRPLPSLVPCSQPMPYFPSQSKHPSPNKPHYPLSRRNARQTHKQHPLTCITSPLYSDNHLHFFPHKISGLQNMNITNFSLLQSQHLTFYNHQIISAYRTSSPVETHLSSLNIHSHHNANTFKKSLFIKDRTFPTLGFIYYTTGPELDPWEGRDYNLPTSLTSS